MCKANLTAAQKLGVLHDLDWKPPSEPYVVAGPTFMPMAIKDKKAFILSVNCFLTAGIGETDQYLSFDVLDWQTGKPIGRFSWGDFAMN